MTVIVRLPGVAFGPGEGLRPAMGTRRWEWVCAAPGDACGFRPVARGTIPVPGPFPVAAGPVTADATVTATALWSWPAPASTPGGHVLAEDGTQRPSALEMAYEPGDPASLPLIDAMARLTADTGTPLVVVARSTGGELGDWLAGLPAAVRQGVRLISLPQPVTSWTQDSGEPRSDGQVVVPPAIGDRVAIGTVIQADRQRRGAVGDYVAMGTMDRTGQRLTRLGSALGEGLTPVAGRAYSEGGNVVVGTDAHGRPYALVGRDTLAVNRAWLADRDGAPASEATAIAALAADFGLAPEQIVPVEQPADFHLDMRLLALPGGHVLLDDAEAAFALQRQWLLADQAAQEPIGNPVAHADWQARGEALQATLTTMATHARAAARLEARTAADLQAAGLQVHRVAGTFPAVRVDGGAVGRLQLPAMDFLNAAQWTTADGKRVAVLLGGDVRAETLVRQQWLTALPTGWDQVAFLDPAVSAASLKRYGGIQCRVKALAP